MFLGFFSPLIPVSCIRNMWPPLHEKNSLGHGSPTPQHLASGGLTVCAIFLGAKNEWGLLLLASLINSNHRPYLQCFQPLVSSQWAELVFSRRSFSVIYVALCEYDSLLVTASPRRWVIGYTVSTCRLQPYALKIRRWDWICFTWLYKICFGWKQRNVLCFVCVLWGAMRVYLSLHLFLVVLTSYNVTFYGNVKIFGPIDRPWWDRHFALWFIIGVIITLQKRVK